MKVNSIFEDDSVTPHYGDSGKEEREKKKGKYSNNFELYPYRVIQIVRIRDRH